MWGASGSGATFGSHRICIRRGGKQFGDRHETVRETLRWAPTLLRTNQEFDEFMDNGK